MKNYLIILLISISLLVFFNSCKKDENNGNNEKNVIRPFTEFTTADIPAFKGMTQISKGEHPRDVTKISNGSYSSEYEFKWVSESDDYAYFNIRIMENHDDAVEAIAEMHNCYTNPFIDESIDDPVVVGNISYMKGREFIRDNLIVRIHSSDKFDELITEIANYIDSKILNSPTFMSISRVKPVIKEFKINKNPAIEHSKTPLTIQIEDPNDMNIVYQWRADDNSGSRSISKDDSGIYYYTSSWFDSKGNNIGLTLIAINEYGFCDDSTINIQIVKRNDINKPRPIIANIVKMRCSGLLTMENLI